MTKMGMRRTTPQIPLRRSKGINRMSKGAKLEFMVWKIVRQARMLALVEKYGYLPCEHCLKPIINSSELFCPEGHHNNHNRRDNSEANCRILHKVCNQLIEDKNIKDVKSLL